MSRRSRCWHIPRATSQDASTAAAADVARAAAADAAAAAGVQGALRGRRRGHGHAGRHGGRAPPARARAARLPARAALPARVATRHHAAAGRLAPAVPASPSRSVLLLYESMLKREDKRSNVYQ